MFEDYQERLFAHYVGGQWRAPFGSAALGVPGRGGVALGQVVLADARDAARAVALRAGAQEAARARFVRRIEGALPDLSLALLQQFGQAPETPRMDALIAGLSAPGADRPGLVLGSRDGSLEDLGRALGAGLRFGVIWCPPPEQAVFATAFAQLAQASDLPPGAFSLLHARAATTEAALRATGLRVADI